MPIDPISMVAAGAGVLGAAQGIFRNRDKEDARQLEQQKKLTQVQVGANKELAQNAHELQLDMWNKTNYEAQVEHLKNAGLNPGLMYGMGGGGGVTAGAGNMGSASGGSAADSASQANAETAKAGMAMQLGMMKAQMDVLKSQADKNKAEAAKIAGVDTREGTARATEVEFRNELNRAIGIDKMQSSYSWSVDKLEISFAKELAEYNAWQAASFEGKPTDDKNSPLAKAMSAGMKQKLEELKGAKLDNNVKQAEGVIKAFEAGLAEQGIPPNSPWGVKFIADLLEKAGLIDLIKPR